jgi:signal transduction histidine kinase
VVGVVADVTARHRLAEERERRSRSSTSAAPREPGLLAGALRDFNSLLVGILATRSRLARLPEEAEVRPLIGELRAAAARAADLANQILTYSGRGALQRAPVDVAGLARETLALMHPSLRRAARLQLVCSPEPQFVAGDATQLRQVLMNLLTNGCESLPESGGDVRITVSHRSASPPGDGTGSEWVALEVADSGSGMDPLTRARIFDPFFTTRANGRGPGCGRARIVRAHGGTIDVDSARARTRMRILLPRPARRGRGRASRPAPVDAAAASASARPTTARGAARRRLALEAAGHRVLPPGRRPAAAPDARARSARSC